MFISGSLSMNYTHEMQKGMYAANGIGYEVYRRSHGARMQVEKRREKEYRQSKQMMANIVSHRPE